MIFVIKVTNFCYLHYKNQISYNVIKITFIWSDIILICPFYVKWTISVCVSKWIPSLVASNLSYVLVNMKVIFCFQSRWKHWLKKNTTSSNEVIRFLIINLSKEEHDYLKTKSNVLWNKTGAEFLPLFNL